MLKVFVSAAAVAVAAGSAPADVLLSSLWNNGFFTPFNASTSSNIRYGDSAWVGTGSSAPVQLDRIVLSMVVFNAGTTPIAAGTTNIAFTFNDGDPSGLVFGSGATLRTVNIGAVPLPAVDANSFEAFDLEVPLSGVSTLGGFNNVGWSVGVSSFNYGGSLGFACTRSTGMLNGFYTNNASFYNGTSWSLFSFGSNPVTGIAQFRATLYSIPAPGAGLLLSAGVLAAARRRR